MTFPLPIVAFEDYLLADDRPAYPMNFFIRMKFSGRVDRRAATAALAEMAGRHPMVTARIRRHGRRKLRWEQPADTTIPLHEVKPIAKAEDFPFCPGLDVRSEGGMAGYHLECGPKDHLLWQFHHACCDGLGAFQLLDDWLVAYAKEAGDDIRDNALRSLDEGRLLGRGRFGLTAWRLLKKARRQAVGLAGVRQFLMRKPAPIVPDAFDEIDQQLPDQYPAALTHMFTLDQSLALRQAAKRFKCTVNDLLVRDLFLAFGRFRQRQSLGDIEDWLRVSIPINLRRASDRSLSAANVVSMVFLDRRSGDFDDPAALLNGIHDEMQLIKDNELGLTYILSLWLARRMPGGLAGQSDRYRCTATCLFTNLGNLFARTAVPRDEQKKAVVGGLVLESLDLIAPIRPFTGAAFTPFHYARCLGTTIHYDPRMFSADRAAELLRDYVDYVEASAASA